MNDRAAEIEAIMAKNRQHIIDLTDTYIKNLAVTTGLYDCITDPYDALNNGDSYSSVMPDLVKFAELIIKECVALQHKNVIIGGVSEYNRGRREMAEDILKHFGVTL